MSSVTILLIIVVYLMIGDGLFGMLYAYHVFTGEKDFIDKHFIVSILIFNLFWPLLFTMTFGYLAFLLLTNKIGDYKKKKNKKDL